MAIVDKLRKQTISWIYKYDMINNGDKVIIAVSGGKDSLVMLDILDHLSKFSGLKFTYVPVYVIPKIVAIKIFSSELETLFKKYTNDYIIHEMKIPKDSKLNKGMKEGKTCQWCSYARRITLMKLAEKIGANKIAYGHHMDDTINTLFINIKIGSKMMIIPPFNRMKKGDLALIRPMISIREEQIIRYGESIGIKPLKANCPLEKISERKKMEKVLKSLEEQIPNFVENMFTAYLKRFGTQLYQDTDNSALK